MHENAAIASQPQGSPTAMANNVVPVQERQLDPEPELIDRLPIQLKLSVGAPDDPMEYEADAMADKVMRMPETPFIQRKSSGGSNCDYDDEHVQLKPLINEITPFIQRKSCCSSCEYDDEHVHLKPLASQITPFIQAKSDNVGVVSDAVSSRIQSSMGGGSPMDGGTKSFMENRFGADFSGVKIHNGNESAELSGDLNARAFTVKDNIYFNSGQYQPNSDSGKHLLAHELTHVVQQQPGVAMQIQKKPPVPGSATKEIVGDDYVILENDLTDVPAGGLYPGVLEDGYIKIELLNLPPEKAKLFIPAPQPEHVIIDMPDEMHPPKEQPTKNETTTPLPPPPAGPQLSGPKKAIVLRITRRISIRTKNGLAGHIVLRAQTTLSKSFEITKNSPRKIIDQLCNYPFGLSNISILFSSTFPGELPESADPINDQQATSLNDIIHIYAPELVGYDQTAQQQYDAAIRLLLAYVPHTAIALDDPKRKIGGTEYKTLAEAKKAAEAMGKKDILIVQTPDGKFHLYELTQMDLFRIANELRMKGGSDPKVDWHSMPNKVKVEKLYLEGKEVNVDSFADNYLYVDPEAAAAGSIKAPEIESVIYKMRSSGFFARKPVTHQEALDIWNTIDEKIEFPENIGKAYYLAEGQFVALNVKGVGEFHSIGADYVEGKRIYLKNADEYNKDVKRVMPDGQEYTPLMYDIYKGAGGQNLLLYIEAQLDRGIGNDFNFRQGVQDKKFLKKSLTLVVRNKLDNEARVIALNILTKTYGALKALADSDDAMRNLVLSLPKMGSKERKDVLSMMGVPEDKRDIYNSILSDPNITSQIAFGIPVKTISFQVLRSGMKTVVTDTAKIIKQIKDYEVLPLRIDGDFGNLIRDEVYRINGFTKIKGNTYPHHDETKGFMPDELAGDQYSFSGLREQIFANDAANMADATLVLMVTGGTIAAIVIAGVVILSGGIGAGVAAAFFEAGTAGFVATEIVVGAAAMTVMGEGINQAIGQGDLSKDKAYYGFGDLAKTFGENLVLSGVFAGLGRIMKSASAIYRLSATGSLFLGYSLGKYYYQNKKLPQGRELFLFIYSNLVTLAAIEGGSALARPLTEMFYAKGLDARVGIINKKITDLKLDILTSQKKLAVMVATGIVGETEGLQLISEQRVLLERQQKILIELRDAKELTTDIDVNWELQKVEDALQKIKVTEFQRKIDFKQNQFAPDKIGYKPGQSSIDEIINFYGKDNVTGPDKDGFVKVKLPDGSEIDFYPEDKKGEITRAAIERPPVKLDKDTAHSINVNWNNIDAIPEIKVLKGASPKVSAKDFWNEKGSTLYDIVYEGRYYVKYDTANGRLLIGDAQSGDVIGFYLDDARNYPNPPHSDVLVKDPLKDLPKAIEKLKTYHGLTGTNAPLKGNFSSGAKIVTQPGKTTTVIGAFVVVDGKITYTDMPQLFENFGNLKNADFNQKEGGYNVLNVGEGFYEPGTFFDNYNRPWLLEAIKRNDIIYSASDPKNPIFIFKRDSSGNWETEPDPITGNPVKKRTGFGKEVLILEQNGYDYDPATKTFKK